MHTRTSELLKHLEAQHERMRRAVEGVPREHRGVKPSAEQWCVSEVIEHVSIVDTGIARLLTRQLEEARAAGRLIPEMDETPVVGTLDTDRLLDRTRRISAPEFARPSGALDAEAAWAALERARQTLCDAVRAVDGLALGDMMYTHPALGPMNMYQWIAFAGTHEARHAAQVVEIGESVNPAG